MRLDVSCEGFGRKCVRIYTGGEKGLAQGPMSLRFCGKRERLIHPLPLPLIHLPTQTQRAEQPAWKSLRISPKVNFLPFVLFNYLFKQYPIVIQ